MGKLNQFYRKNQTRDANNPAAPTGTNKLYGGGTKPIICKPSNTPTAAAIKAAIILSL